MSRTTLGFTAAILSLLPCAALADVYPAVPSPSVPGAAPQNPSLRQVFSWLDTNHDGYLTLGEFLAAPWITNKTQGKRFFYWMDTNKDGLVSLPEFLAANRRYTGVNGISIQTTYPWAWSFWRPWRYGWYWQSGWRRRPGNWPAYTVHRNIRGGHANHVATHVNVVRHPHAVAKHVVKHRRPAGPKRRTGHKAHAHKAHPHKGSAHRGHGHSGHGHTSHGGKRHK